jgi:hypothetical protein
LGEVNVDGEIILKLILKEIWSEVVDWIRGDKGRMH